MKLKRQGELSYLLGLTGAITLSQAAYAAKVMDVTKSGDRRVGESTEAAKTRLQTDMDKAYGVIIEGIEPSQYQYVEDAETVIAAYKALSDHHEPKSKIDKLALSSEYHSMSWYIKEETYLSSLNGTRSSCGS
ncbi:hypothetical protein H257_19101 [Aphanomyces astaci]|uniref:Uncharacterized protein n=1 Tax=Aphanomyces astaci TaxID=112090 RepID=W4FB68_APHAT|nr:hypothetical protein H257_19101 [Aphanomyces astaci]ETV63963.1 hypothetical protein H257_19101 [Aphanomyces astaci]|eukprot:XP_009846552.1 hypothetical protein H257_19101 [Aphanomyces astaci]